MGLLMHTLYTPLDNSTLALELWDSANALDLIFGHNTTSYYETSIHGLTQLEKTSHFAF